MKRIMLSDGYEVELADEVLDNMELVDALADIKDDTDILAISKVIQLILGAKEKTRLYEHLRTEDGRVPVKRVSEAIKEIFKGYKDAGKNS